jgi:hypothetical protein
MLVAYRLARLSAISAPYAGVKRRAMLGDAQRSLNKPMRQRGSAFQTPFIRDGSRRP